MNPLTLLKDGYGISPILLIFGIVVYIGVFMWQGWIGILLITIGNILAIINKVIIKAETGAYDDDELKWEDTKNGKRI